MKVDREDDSPNLNHVALFIFTDLFSELSDHHTESVESPRHS